MTTIQFWVSQEDVYQEVALTTSYTGKKSDDATAYERVFTTDEDQLQLERFWQECEAEVSHELIRVIEKAGMEGTEYGLRLKVSGAFDPALKESMGMSLRSYFVQSITGKWFALANKGEAAEYEARAKALLDDVKRKAFYKKSPARPTYT